MRLTFNSFKLFSHLSSKNFHLPLHPLGFTEPPIGFEVSFKVRFRHEWEFGREGSNKVCGDQQEQVGLSRGLQQKRDN